MRFTTLVSASVVAIALAATMNTVSAADKSKTDNVKAVPTASRTQPAATNQFSTLKGVKAAPMSSRELVAVKGRHVHFLDGNGGFHLAGNPEKQMNNWQNLGGSDGLPVAPSYHGLCVAQGVGTGGISSPGAGVECP